MTELERKLRAKIPGADTKIEIRHSICDICSPGMHCGLNCYVKDDKIIKIEGQDGHPINNGKLCTKGLANRQYLYREDRIMTPLRRVGERGEGKFEPITWEEAYAEIAEKLNETKMQYGPESVAFFSGFSKWYRPMLRRFAYSFGSPNYGSESSSCYTSAFMAWKVAAGDQGAADMENSDLFLGWAFNPYYSNYMSAARATKLKEKGLKFLIVDTRITPAVEKLADVVLRPRSGTDGAVAHAIANVLISRGQIDMDYITSYVYGFDEYAEYVKGFNEENIEKLTGVPYEDILRAADLIAESRRISFYESSAPLTHHRNGLQNYRSIIALLAITGNIDRTGGQKLIRHTYIHVACGFDLREEEFQYGTRPLNAKPPIGADRFPLWNELEGEMQAMALPLQIESGNPYPVKSVFALGLNARMWPDSGRMFRALQKLDFFVDVDLFLTDAAKYADIVLPACTSMERGEFKPYPGGLGFYTKPAISPLGMAKSDVQILSELANVMNLDDKLLKAGYDACISYIIQDLDVTVDELKAVDLPMKIAEVKPFVPLSELKNGLNTPTGKIELKSALIEQHPEWKLDALPTYMEPLDDADPDKYPFTFTSGSRIPHAIHSRLHKCTNNRSLRPNPTADMSLEDCEALGLKEGDRIVISTLRGELHVPVHPTIAMPKGLVNLYHGYSEADANSLLNAEHLDPYSGFPAYRSSRCAVRKEEAQ